MWEQKEGEKNLDNSTFPYDFSGKEFLHQFDQHPLPPFQLLIRLAAQVLGSTPAFPTWEHRRRSLVATRWREYDFQIENEFPELLQAKKKVSCPWVTISEPNGSKQLHTKRLKYSLSFLSFFFSFSAKTIFVYWPIIHKNMFHCYLFPSKINIKLEPQQNHFQWLPSKRPVIVFMSTWNTDFVDFLDQPLQCQLGSF